MGLLSHDEISKLHAAIVSARLADSRDALLAGVERSFVAGLPHASTPSAQILGDLGALNDTEKLTDGSVPLAVWLANAVALAGARTETSVFEIALASLRRASYRSSPSRRTPTLSLTHAPEDRPRADAVAQYLAHAGVYVRGDHEVPQGASLVNFIEHNLAHADHCLLLWSSALAGSNWAQAEWESAIRRMARERRNVLFVGRLDEAEVPSFLSTRQRVDLFPRLSPGLDSIVETCLLDVGAQEESGRPIGTPRAALQEDDDGVVVYISSQLFDFTIPARLSLDLPTGLHLDRIVDGLRLPRRWHHADRVGVHFEYSLLSGEARLERSRSLREEGLRAGSSLVLESTLVPISVVTPAGGEPARIVYRHASEDAGVPDAQRAAFAALRMSVSRAGLRRG